MKKCGIILILFLGLFCAVLQYSSNSKKIELELTSLFTKANANNECEDDEKHYNCTYVCDGGIECTGTCCLEGTIDCNPDNCCDDITS